MIEAAETNQRRVFTFFLLDLNLPAHAGLELLARIRRSPLMARMPVVIVTSSDAVRDRMSIEKSGADYYFCKPSRLETFLELGSIVQRLWVEHIKRVGRIPIPRGRNHKETYE
jgi:DNA-binding response OmpR family regulator